MAQQLSNTLDARKIFDHAQKFQWTQEYMRHKDRATTEAHVLLCGDPCLVLSALASELFLKCLLVIAGQPKKTFDKVHNLYDLYSKLHPQIKQRIVDLWDQQVWAPETREFFRYVEDHIAKEPIPRHFATALRLGANTFIDLRYVYEKKRNINNLIVDLPLILRRVIYEIHPEWKQ